MDIRGVDRSNDSATGRSTVIGKDAEQRSGNRGSDLRRRLGRWFFLVGGPLLLAIAFAVHPHQTVELLVTDTGASRWLEYHVVLLPLLGTLGVSLYVLLTDFDGPVAAIGRAGVCIYLVGYVAFEAIAGIAIGFLVRDGRGLSGEQRAVVVEIAESIAADPVVIGLALVGTAGGLLAVIALGILFRHTGAPLAPVAFLGGAPLAMIGHGGGYADVFGTVLFVVGVVWLGVYDRPGERSRVSA